MPTGLQRGGRGIIAHDEAVPTPTSDLALLGSRVVSETPEVSKQLKAAPRGDTTPP